MGKTKYGKYIVEDFNGRPMNDVRAQDAFQKILFDIAVPILYLDDTMIKGSFCAEFMWYHTASDVKVEAHTHEVDEILGFVGSDPRDYPMWTGLGSRVDPAGAKGTEGGSGWE